MTYYNSMEITFETNTTALEALEILKNRLADGFSCDKTYRRNPSMRMINDLRVDENSISLPDEDDFYENGYYLPEHFGEIMCELLKFLAENLNGKTFECISNNESDCDSLTFEAQYNKDTLTVKTTYYPNGYTEHFYCEDCRTMITSIDEYNENETYICPECGEEFDPTEQKLVITEKTFVIA